MERTNTHHFRDRMEEAGFTISGARDHPICPVMLGDAKLASTMADKLLEKGIYVIGFSFPVVPRGQARIRTQMSAGHDDERVRRQLGRQLRAARRVGRSCVGRRSAARSFYTSSTRTRSTRRSETGERRAKLLKIPRPSSPSWWRGPP